MKRARALAPIVLVLVGCREREEAHARPSTVSSAESGPAPLAPPARAPALLYLPDGGDVALEGFGRIAPEPWTRPTGRCPGEMVDVAGRFCIDRFEAVLVDTRLGREVSPYFPPRRADVRSAFEAFEGTTPRGAPPLPEPPEWQLTEGFAVRAVSRRRVVPNGYVSGVIAREACTNAGKRLCSTDEWRTACRGERGHQFPYGATYQHGACNVHREAHPAAVLWGDASKNHLDPRLNVVEGASGPLLRKTGETERCRSVWEADAVFDMVGNLDEWVDEPGGAFAGGFYARATTSGCDARITDHPPEYFDYSLGVRCCL